MSDHPLNDAARRENALTLAAALNMTTDAAAGLLDACIVVTADSNDVQASAIADDVVALLQRTVSEATRSRTTSQAAAAEVVVGGSIAQTSAPSIRVSVSEESVVVNPASGDAGPCAPVPRIFLRLAACYVAAAALQSALGSQAFVQMPDPFVLRFADLGISREQLVGPVDIGHAYLAGAGAIGNGFLWAAEHVEVHGELTIADDDQVSDGNLNRQILFHADDIGLSKAERLAFRAQRLTPSLVLRSRTVRLQGLQERTEGPWLKRLIVAVDSRRARRALQRELPGEVFDASTTDIREVVVHYNKQPTQNACMSCIYLPDEAEYTREHHIAEQLGVGVEDVRSERISAESANRIAARYAALTAASIVGTAYDTLFKQLCGEAALQTTDGNRVLAPFAFVSCLAGTLLVLEIVRRLAPVTAEHTDNYWRVSAWHPPVGRGRVLRPREPKCECCGNRMLADACADLWVRPATETVDDAFSRIKRTSSESAL